MYTDVDADQDALKWAGLSPWWKWEAGSRYFFWRWPTLFQCADPYRQN